MIRQWNLWTGTMNTKIKNNAELWGAIYKKLKEIDENRKFRKTIDRRQVVLEDAIKEKLKCSGKK